MTYWKPSKKINMLGMPCIEHSLTGEHAIVGTYGEMWVDNENYFWAVIINPKVARALGHELDRGSELMLTFPLSMAKEIAKLIKARPSLHEQCAMAERFHDGATSTRTIYEAKKHAQI